ncbi:hypothetical protein Ciccas_012795 [Cichlidogyrus casuarinus]|uniref:Uncharacterized protein n=1 Tax=Cichlidogyrus casuarinus TaxID=1844966 RepID=A0ABD2PME3_9PLAT
MLNFNAVETASNGSGGTLVSGQHHPLLGENGRGSDSQMCYHQSPRNKSASTEQTTTPCTASSLVDEGGSAGSGLGLKPFLNYGVKSRNLYSPGSPCSSGHDRPSNCSSPSRHQCCTQHMLLSDSADFGLV